MPLTRDLLADFLRDRTRLQDVTGDVRLFSTGALDSVSQLDLITLIESTAGITIDEADITLENMDSMDRILAFVEAQTGKRG